MPPLVDPDAVPASLCDPKDDGNCVDFCSRLAPECAVPWRTVPSCLLPSEQEFRREIFRRDTADRPEAHVQGRVTDEAGRRIEGAKISVWLQGTVHRRGGVGQGRQLSPAPAHGALDAIPCASATPALRDRDRRPAHREAGHDPAHLPAGARKRDPRARASATRASRSPAPPSTPFATPRIRSPPARRRAPTTARSRWAGSTPSATSCARRSSAGCPRR